jgi:putative membrane protein
MYGDHMDGWDWVWMSVMPVIWIALIGVVVYVAVRLANGSRKHP